jgi:hypothetical protein
MPSSRETAQEAGEILLPKRRMWLTAIGQKCEVLLHPADFIEQLKRVKCFGNVAQAGFDLVGDCVRRKQPCTGRFGVVIALDDARANATLNRPGFSGGLRV